MNLTAFINLAWGRVCRSSFAKLKRALEEPERIQERYLMNLVRNNRNTEFGERFGFADIGSVEEFRANIPMLAYEDYVPFIKRISEGHEAVLSKEEVQLFEPSSGSASPCKLIPYTSRLRKEFRQAIDPWIASMFRAYPGTARGRAYWSISPPVEEERFYGCRKVGFDSDSSYLGVLGRFLFGKIAVLPGNITEILSNEEFYTRTLTALLAERNLAFVSVWSPTFLTIMLDYYLDNREMIWDALAETGIQRNGERVSELKSMEHGPDMFARVWPHLALISCWQDGPSAVYADDLSGRFPGVPVQGKGLLSTEAVVSIPIFRQLDPVLAVRSHFFEFMAENGDCVLAHEASLGAEYEIVVTTGGGLYRYRTGDRVAVTGFAGETPTLRFLGKVDAVSDLFGEKLHAIHVDRAIDECLGGLPRSFALLAPDTHARPTAYTLYLKTDSNLPSGLEDKLQMLLCENPQYRYCCELGQLGPVRIFRIEGHASKAYLEYMSENGLKIGDVKPVVLSLKNDWTDVFSGAYQVRERAAQ